MMTSEDNYTYGTAILSAFDYLLENHPEVFVIGQGLWSPWYVGSSMTDLDKKYGTSRIIDTPVSESACTGAAVGAALAGMRPIVVHPRMDFMLYAMDSIVNEAAKWRHMTGGQACVPVTVRSIINRGGEQGAQHSQALHSWFAHVPGLRVVMPATVSDARDLLISSVLSNDPVVYIDDRWLYDQTDDLQQVKVTPLAEIEPQVLSVGKHITIVGVGYGTKCALEASVELNALGVSAEIVDLRILSPLKLGKVVESVERTGRLVVVDPGWRACSVSSEIITSIVEEIDLSLLKSPPKRISLPDCPAPTSKLLEKAYYFGCEDVVSIAKGMMNDGTP
ncbi:MAG: transketolase C-terminal domain-containing protein [Pseudomonadota bacterium]|nr:transketolase C-terminal domain-containing protein [Pseudomonadota bacterium]